jgi:hypothetical protein
VSVSRRLETAGRRLRHVSVQEALRIFAVAFLLNWIWEATHAAAYVESAGPFLYRLRHCLPMASTDALWTLALWAIVTGVIPRPDSTWRFTGLAALGAASAIAVERVALADGRWTYNALMPIVSIVDVGLWPVAQMTVLPVITVWLARARPPRRLASGQTGRLA